MAGAIIENLSGRKLGILIGFLMICQIVCFLVGGLIAPAPSSVMSMLGTKCIDKNYKNTQWYWSRGKQPCKSISDFESIIVQEQKISANDVIFSFQIPIPKDGFDLDYSRWQQNLIAMLHLDILYDDEDEVAPNAVMTLDARLGYSNRGDPEGKWTEYASSVEQRQLDCSIELKKTGYMYNCSHVPLFELGSLHHDYYLLNVRMPVDTMGSEETDMNTKLGHIKDVWVAVSSKYEFNSYYPNCFAFVPHSTWGTLVEGNCSETVLRNTGRDPVSCLSTCAFVSDVEVIDINNRYQSIEKGHHYDNFIVRYKVMGIKTLTCAALIITYFILLKESEAQWDRDDNIKLNYTNAFFTGVYGIVPFSRGAYGMWNIYTFALICLYAPSHKRWPKDQNWPISDSCGLASIHGALLARDTQSSTGEEIEFSRLATEPSEMSSLTAFTKKAATD
ncbi:protein wntless-like [Penaeus japonicus]|uniref:protein wntless-like n=1 Tax=Penaeus japonicus TaxID=27405 RepID=UPI001C70B082|nr:protein wntless-like [Penaeus japonicus]